MTFGCGACLRRIPWVLSDRVWWASGSPCWLSEGAHDHEFWVPYYRFQEEGATLIVAGPEKGRSISGEGRHGKDGRTSGPHRRRHRRPRCRPTRRPGHPRRHLRPARPAGPPGHDSPWSGDGRPQEDHRRDLPRPVGAGQRGCPSRPAGHQPRRHRHRPDATPAPAGSRRRPSATATSSRPSTSATCRRFCAS